jgi:hypothetical protein
MGRYVVRRVVGALAVALAFAVLAQYDGVTPW